jgi:hypothetical protein
MIIICTKKIYCEDPRNDNCALRGHYAVCLTQKSAILLYLAEGSMKSRNKEKYLSGERERESGTGPHTALRPTFIHMQEREYDFVTQKTSVTTVLANKTSTQ